MMSKNSNAVTEDMFTSFMENLYKLGIQEIRNGNTMEDPISQVDYILSIIENNIKNDPELQGVTQ